MDTGNFWNVILWSFWFFIWIAALMVWFRCLIDMFSDHTLSGWAKAGWVILLVFVPWLGALIYLIARGRSMADRSMKAVAEQQGFDIRNDFAAPLGGEFAFAIDGPILPTPSWKIILEVYDQPKLQNTFERAIAKLNEFSMIHGKGKLTLETSAVGDRTYYSIRSDAGVEVHYTYANGYLVAAQTRALLEQSLRNREAGNTLVRSSRFMSSLPQDGNTNFSAIFYHDLAPLMQPLAERLKNAGSEMSEQDRQKLAAIDMNAPPTLVYAYSQGDRITLAANTEGGAFGLSPASLIGLPNSFQMQHILMNAMGDKNVEKKSE